jgi:hypothetical protein
MGCSSPACRRRLTGGVVSIVKMTELSSTRQQGPGVVGHDMPTSQSRRHCLVVERPGGPDDFQADGQFATVTQRAVEIGADVVGPAHVGGQPRPVPERRSVAHMLVV